MSLEHLKTILKREFFKIEFDFGIVQKKKIRNLNFEIGELT